MNFWGIEVEAGNFVTISPKPLRHIHLTGAVLVKNIESGDQGYGNEQVRIDVESQKNHKTSFKILSPSEYPQISTNYIFDGSFKIRHNWKKGEVHFLGYEFVVMHDDAYDSDRDYSISRNK